MNTFRLRPRRRNARGISRRALLMRGGAAAAAASFAERGLANQQPLAISETRRNISGHVVDLAPVKFLAVFNVGEVPPTSTLRLRGPDGRVVPETHWQWNERSSFPDRSLRSCVVRCLGPVGWQPNTDRTWTVEVVPGARIEEADRRTPAMLAELHDASIQLTDVRRLGPNGSNEQAVWGSGRMVARLADALRGPTVEKRHAGPICTQWYCWQKLRNGGEDDAFLWVKHWIEVWQDPDSGRAIHVSWEPLIINGWARRRSLSLAYKLALRDGDRVVRDFSFRQDFTPQNVDTKDNGFTYGLDKGSTLIYPGSAIVFRAGRGRLPRAIKEGLIYPVSRFYYDDARRGFVLKDMSHDDRWKEHGPILKLTDGGAGTWQGETRIVHISRRGIVARDENGFELWLDGGARIVPNWSRAEKIRRQRSGHIYPVDWSEATPDPLPPHDAKFVPGTQTYHRTMMDSPGGVFHQGYHVGEITTWFFDLMCEMDSARRHHVMRRAAGEVLTHATVGLHEIAVNPATGVEWATPIVINNGPDKKGTPYAGLGPCWPNALDGPAGTNYGISGIWDLSGPREQQDWNIQNVVSGGDDGDHVSTAMSKAWKLYASSVDQECATMHWIKCATYVNPSYFNYPQGGANKRHNGVTYYRFHMLALNDGQNRTNAGINGLMVPALFFGDSNPYGAVIRDILKDNVDYFNIMYADASLLGTRAKNIGIMGSAWSGGEQHWQQTRVASSGMRLLKLSGLDAPNLLRHQTAQARMWYGDPVGGKPLKQPIPGLYALATFGCLYFPRAEPRNPSHFPPETPRSTEIFFRDIAADSAGCADIALAGNAGYTFLADGKTIRQRSIAEAFVLNLQPNEGDAIAIDKTAPPPGLPVLPIYYLYRKGGTPTQATFLLSSTPGPNWTPVTWQPGRDFTPQQGPFTFLFSGPAGTGPGGLLPVENASVDYGLNAAAPLACALSWFNDKGCERAYANYLALRQRYARELRSDWGKGLSHMYTTRHLVA